MLQRVRVFIGVEPYLFKLDLQLLNLKSPPSCADFELENQISSFEFAEDKDDHNLLAAK